MSIKIKYPKIWHLPWSRSFDTHDRVLSYDQIEKFFVGKDVVVTEKLDGENTTMTHDYIHARSVDSKNHPSRTWVKNLHGRIRFDILSGYRLCGENVYAKHSILYNGLPSAFFIFGVYNPDNTCLSWNFTESVSIELGIEHVPVLYHGIFDIDTIQKLFTGKSVFGTSEQEGYVVRLSGEIAASDHVNSFAKFVRPNHVRSPKNWMTMPMVKNKGSF